jgi:hypothetical protein
VSGAQDVGGATVGVAAGALFGGGSGALVGAAVGAAVPNALRYAAAEISRRLLGPREQLRVVSALDAAAEAIEERLKRGEVPRSDGFFKSAPDGRSPGEEVAEGVLLAAQPEHEERKVQYMGRLLAGIAFDPTISRADANLLVRTAERLSFRQTLLLQYFGEPPAAVREDDYRAAKQTDTLTRLLTEIYELYQRGLVNNGGDVALSVLQLRPAIVRTQGLGATLANLTRGETVEYAGELNTISRILHEVEPERNNASP